MAMIGPEPLMPQGQSSSISRDLCPSWCVTGHRAELGEEDWLHCSEPMTFVDGLPALLAMSIDPGTGEVDGPYVMIGSSEYSVTEAIDLAEGLLRLVSVNDGIEALPSSA
jgi:hypothetical protein